MFRVSTDQWLSVDLSCSCCERNQETICKQKCRWYSGLSMMGVECLNRLQRLLGCHVIRYCIWSISTIGEILLLYWFMFINKHEIIQQQNFSIINHLAGREYCRATRTTLGGYSILCLCARSIRPISGTWFWIISLLPMGMKSTVVSPPPMSSRHRNQEPSERWHAPICLVAFICPLVGPTLCTSAMVKSNLVNHWAAWCTSKAYCAPSCGAQWRPCFLKAEGGSPRVFFIMYLFTGGHIGGSPCIAVYWWGGP